MNPKLPERKQKILGAIVEDYLNSAEPVGSRTISKKYLPRVSPATIRNEMADLEEEGYIKQPHTSAGRIPADAGYRYYVDELMKPKGLTAKEIEYIKREYKRINNDIEDILKTTAKIAASLSDYATMITAPRLHRRVIKVVNMVLLDVHKAAVMLLTDSGQSDNMLLKLPKGKIDQDDLVKISNLLTHKLQGVNVSKLNSLLIQEIVSEIPVYKGILEDAMHLIKRSMEKHEREKVISAGLSNIAKQPEFSDIENMKSILKIIEHDHLMRGIIKDHAENKGVTIKIGSEIKYKEIHDCSLVLTQYSIADVSYGALGIIGPTRMPYNKVKSIVEHVSDTLSEVLSEDLL